MMKKTKSVVDVVVIGTGPAGMAATASALAHGAHTVAALETQDDIGGNAVHSNGYLTFVNTALQQKNGLFDSVETFMTDAERSIRKSGLLYGIEYDAELLKLFARESAVTYETLRHKGAAFNRIVSRPQQHTIDRMLEIASNKMFRTAFASDFQDTRVTTYFGTRAEELIVRRGRVHGIRAHHNCTQKHIDIHARRGVVLATGGYQSNPGLRRRYQPENRSTSPYLGIDTCTGTGHLLGQAAGADLVNMTFLPPMIIVASTVVENSIAVNTTGKRFHDETEPFDQRVAHLRAQPGNAAWYIFDHPVAQQRAALIRQMPETPISAPTITELARSVGIPDENLSATMHTWNQFLNSDLSEDPDFRRRNLPAGRRPCGTPPFYAAPMVEGINFSCGGLRTTTSMQVMNVFGRPIPGLYAAGDCASGVNAAAEMGGLHISGALTLGRVAGAAAARGSADRHTYRSVLP